MPISRYAFAAATGSVQLWIAEIGKRHARHATMFSRFSSPDAPFFYDVTLDTMPYAITPILPPRAANNRMISRGMFAFISPCLIDVFIVAAAAYGASRYADIV